MRYLSKLFVIIFTLNTFLFLNSAFASSPKKTTNDVSAPKCVAIKVCNAGKGEHINTLELKYESDRCTPAGKEHKLTAFRCYTIHSIENGSKIKLKFLGIAGRTLYLSAKPGKIECGLRSGKLFSKKSRKCYYV